MIQSTHTSGGLILESTVKIPSYIQKNRFGIYVYRRAIPKELKQVINKCEIIYSLRTRDPHKAIRLSRLATLSIESYFEKVKQSMNMLHIESEFEGDHTKLLRKAMKLNIPIYTEILDCDAKILSDINWAAWDGDSLFHVPYGQSFHYKYEDGYSKLSEDELKRLLRNKSIEMNILGTQGSESIYHLDESQHITLSELHIRQSDAESFINKTVSSSNSQSKHEDQLAQSNQLNGDLVKALNKLTSATQQPAADKTKEIKTIKVSELIDQYNEHRQITNGKKWNMDSGQKAKFRRLIEITDDATCDQITREVAKDVRKKISKLPENSARFRNQTVKQILSVSHKETLSPKTIKDHLDLYCNLFEWAIQEDIHSGKNPFPNLAPKDKIPKDKKRDMFTKPELSKIFSGSVFTDFDTNNDRPHHYWAPLIALFTGARNAEIGALEVDDIYKSEDNDIWVFDINTHDDKTRVKTGNAIRKVPIHPKLIELGLIKYRDLLKQQGKQRLFEYLKWESKVGYGRYIGENFNDYLKKINIYVKRKKVFYSFRHTVATELERKGVSSLRIEKLSGRASTGFKTTGEQHYIKPADAVDLIEDINKLDFTDEIKLVIPFKNHI